MYVNGILLCLAGVWSQSVRCTIHGVLIFSCNSPRTRGQLTIQMSKISIGKIALITLLYLLPCLYYIKDMGGSLPTLHPFLFTSFHVRAQEGCRGGVGLSTPLEHSAEGWYLHVTYVSIHRRYHIPGKFLCTPLVPPPHHPFLEK